MNHSLSRFAFPLLMGALLAACSSSTKPSSSATSNAPTPVSSKASVSSKTPDSSKAPSSEPSSSDSEEEDDRKPFETMKDTTDTSGVLGDGVSLDLTKLSRLDQCSDSDQRGGTAEYTSIKKDGARVNAVYFSQSKPAISYWAKTDGNKSSYPTGSGLYNNNGYSEFRFAKTFDAEITGTMTVEFDYVLSNQNVTTPAAVEAANPGASGKDARENDGTYVAQYKAKATAESSDWLNGANLDEANYRAGENGYTVTGFLVNDGAWHHIKIERAIVSNDGTVTFKFYHWVGEIALTNVTITAA